jgi:hypothetical protein
MWASFGRHHSSAHSRGNSMYSAPPVTIANKRAQYRPSLPTQTAPAAYASSTRRGSRAPTTFGEPDESFRRMGGNDRGPSAANSHLSVDQHIQHLSQMPSEQPQDTRDSNGDGNIDGGQVGEPSQKKRDQSRTVTHLYTDNVEVRIGARADRDVRGEFWRKVVSCVMMSLAP